MLSLQFERRSMGVVQLLDIANGGKTVIVCEHFFGAAIVIFLQVELKLIVGWFLATCKENILGMPFLHLKVCMC